jgi:hypothetical protein
MGGFRPNHTRFSQMVIVHNSRISCHIILSIVIFISHACGCTYMLNFFNFDHRKGLHDGARVVFKCFIKQVQLDVSSHELQHVFHFVIHVGCS